MADNKENDPKKGTNGSPQTLDGGWFLVQEADCEEEDDDFDKLFDCSTEGSDISNLIEDEVEVDTCQNVSHLTLLNQQMLAEDADIVQGLKRKYLTPSPKSKVQDLSPRFATISISPQNKSSSKRRLFDDSGIDISQQNEIEDPLIQGVQAKVNACPESVGGADGGVYNTVLLKSNNRIATMLAKFKEVFDLGFRELTRPFKSSKTCCTDWVAAVFGVREELLESSKLLFQQHTMFFQVNYRCTGLGYLALFIFCFNAAKCRETVTKLLVTTLSVSEVQILTDPPKNRSLPVALCFYRLGMAGDAFKFGDYPDWLSRQVLVSHQSAADTFELSKMVQWAYDHEYTDEAEIAFNYAQLAEEDSNAAAWLKCNGQAKYVKDCAHMVRLYRRQEMRETTMSEWIQKCCTAVKEEGDWSSIMKFLKYQDVNFLQFLCAFRSWLEGKPKKNCIVIYGPPDTGKSYFCYSLLTFLKGSVVSFMNSKSHFWLMPLTEAKMGFLDDATHACWAFIDTHMRNALDGNKVSVDCKHRVPLQLKIPPLLITSNINVKAEARYFYLHSRVQTFCFPNPMPLDHNKQPVFSLTNASWKSFFERLKRQLGLSGPDEEAQDGEP
uniref:Replication protein E1 n=1 Tax=Felis catus papillomavirus 4 TaxID=1398507 RepID=A0A8D5WM89_9PAPI|nr:E1 protein [Felis catus papillomavirus 4]